MSIQTVRLDLDKVNQMLGLSSSLVGVKFILYEAEMPSEIEKLSGHRYCQALMKARHGVLRMSLFNRLWHDKGKNAGY